MSNRAGEPTRTEWGLPLRQGHILQNDPSPRALSGRIVALVLGTVATIQFVWCYLWLTRPYVNTAAYEQGLERMPFQGRCLMMFVLRAVHNNTILAAIGAVLRASHFWFPRPVSPEVVVQALVDVLSVAVTGIMATKLYQASSQRQLLTVLVYPLVLVACCATYVLHTVQNFRFVYDLPSMAFFSIAFYLIYARKPLIFFSLLFIVATINRETTLLLLPLLLLDTFILRRGQDGKRESSSRWTLPLVAGLALFWAVWQVALRHVFASNASEFYPRFDWNLKSLFAPQAWPQMLSACGYLLVIVIIWFRKIPDARLRAWLWLVPLWLLFMFSFGILIETRIFGELIPLVVCSATLIFEEELTRRSMSSTVDQLVTAYPDDLRTAVLAEAETGLLRPVYESEAVGASRTD